jgi:hypothetical protein
MRYLGRYSNRWPLECKPGALPLGPSSSVSHYSLFTSVKTTLWSLGLSKLQTATLRCSLGPSGPVSVPCRTGIIGLKFRVPLRCGRDVGRWSATPIVRAVTYSSSGDVQFERWRTVWAVTYSSSGDVQFERWRVVWAVT